MTACYVVDMDQKKPTPTSGMKVELGVFRPSAGEIKIFVGYCFGYPAITN